MGKEWTGQYQCQTQGRREVSWRSDNSSDLRGWWRWDPPPAPAEAPRQESQVPPGKEAMSLNSGVYRAQPREQRTGKWGTLVLGTSFKHVARSPKKKCRTLRGRESIHVMRVIGFIWLILYIVRRWVVQPVSSEFFTLLQICCFAPSTPCGSAGVPSSQGLSRACYFSTLRKGRQSPWQPGSPPVGSLPRNRVCRVMDEVNLPSFHGRFTCMSLISANGSFLHKSDMREGKEKAGFLFFFIGFLA